MPRYLVRFSDSGAGMRDYPEPLALDDEIRDGVNGDYEVVRVLLPQAQSARAIGRVEGLRQGGGELRLRVPRELHKERVIALRLLVGICCDLAHSADEYTDDHEDEQAER